MAPGADKPVPRGVDHPTAKAKCVGRPAQALQQDHLCLSAAAADDLMSTCLGGIPSALDHTQPISNPSLQKLIKTLPSFSNIMFPLQPPYFYGVNGPLSCLSEKKTPLMNSLVRPLHLFTFSLCFSLSTTLNLIFLSKSSKKNFRQPNGAKPSPT